MKLVVAGSRGFNDYARMKEHLDFILTVYRCLGEDITIVCGMARGADMLAHKWATENNVAIIEMPADWDTHGKAAGHIRNEEMAQVATHVIVFWDGVSRGTKNMIDMAKKYKRPLEIVRYG